MYLVQVLFVWPLDQASKKTNKRSTEQQKDSSTKYDAKKERNATSYHFLMHLVHVLFAWPFDQNFPSPTLQSLVLNRARASQSVAAAALFRKRWQRQASYGQGLEPLRQNNMAQVKLGLKIPGMCV